MILRTLVAALFAVAAATSAVAKDSRSGKAIVAVDHHQHLLSPRGAAFLNKPPSLAAPLPEDVRELLEFRSAHWRDAAALKGVYAAGAVVLNVDDDEYGWIRGEAAASHIASLFAAGYRITALAFDENGREANLSGYYSRGDGADVRQIGYVYLRLVTEDGRRKIAVEHSVFPGPRREEPIGADELIGMLDQAGINRAVVLSIAYWFDEDQNGSLADHEAVRAENDWTAAEAAKFPKRLIAFCSFNPLRDHALAELQRCADDRRFKGVKLHFGSADVDLLKSDHVARVRAVFEKANEEGMPIVVHARGGDDYGAQHARILINELLTVAPDIPVQIAHLWGGSNFSDEALAVYAAAVENGEPAARNLIFDVTDAALSVRDDEGRALLAARMRQIGLDRIYYGSDAPIEGHPDAKASWEAFKNAGFLTAEEYEQIARNVAPYLR